MASLRGSLILTACLPVKCAVELTEPEKKTLQQLSRKHPHQDFRTRGLGLLELAGGRRVPAIAVDLGGGDKLVYNWAHSWTDGGLRALWTGPPDRHPPVAPKALLSPPP